MKKKKTLQEILINLNDTGFFGFSLPSKAFLMILCIIHHIQLLALSWIDANIILTQFNGGGDREILNTAITYFTLIEPRKVSEDVEKLPKLVAAIMIIIFFGGYLFIIIVKLFRKNRIPHWICKSYYNLGYSFLLVFSLPAFNILFAIFIDSIRNYETITNSIIWIIVSVVFIFLLLIELYTFFKLLVPLKSHDFFSRFNNNYFLSTIACQIILSLIIILKISEDEIASTTTSWIMAVIDLTAALISNIAITFKCSFFDYDAILFTAFLNSCVLSSAISNFIAMFKIYYYNLVSTSIIIQTIVFSLFLIRVVRNRIKMAQKIDLKNLGLIWKDESWFKINFMNKIKNYEDTYNNQKVFKADLRTHFENLGYSTNFDSKAFLERVSKTKSDDVRLIAAYIYLFEFKDFYNSYLIAESLLRNPFTKLSTLIGALYIQKAVDSYMKEMTESEVEKKMMEKYFSYCEDYDIFKGMLEEYIDENILFFKILKEKIPDLHDIAKKSVRLQKKFNKLDNDISKN